MIELHHPWVVLNITVETGTHLGTEDELAVTAEDRFNYGRGSAFHETLFIFCASFRGFIVIRGGRGG